jgi:predicted 3-demethylubiquinone-9 3-methyltransferase (glyoxalase superfamily)
MKPWSVSVLPPAPVWRDVDRLLLAKGLRGFADGFISLLLPLYLLQLGFTPFPAQICPVSSAAIAVLLPSPPGSSMFGPMQHWRTPVIPKNTICLWYDGTALEAAQFYAKTFADSAVKAVHRAPGDYPSGKEGDVLTVEFTVLGIPCLGLNGGPEFKHNESFSFQVATEDQAETDRLWNAIVGNGGQESACGWCKDKWGLSWQITPRALIEAVTDPDRAAAKRAFEAMMEMGKIDIAKIEAARRG